MIKWLRGIVNEAIGDDFRKNPLIILNERELVFKLYQKLLENFKEEKVGIEAVNVPTTHKAGYEVPRVHVEVGSDSIMEKFRERRKKKPRNRVDLIVLKKKDLVIICEGSCSPGVPSVIFKDADIEMAIDCLLYTSDAADE